MHCLIDPGDQLRRQRAGVSGGYALGELPAVLYAEHECVDLH